MKVFPASEQVFEEMSGVKFVPHDGEGVVFINLVALKPTTIEKGNPKTAIDASPGVILCGQLSDIRNQLNAWFDQLAENYKETDKL